LSHCDPRARIRSLIRAALATSWSSWTWRPYEQIWLPERSSSTIRAARLNLHIVRFCARIFVRIGAATAQGSKGKYIGVTMQSFLREKPIWSRMVKASTRQPGASSLGDHTEGLEPPLSSGQIGARATADRSQVSPISFWEKDRHTTACWHSQHLHSSGEMACSN
jgi:hypothetical protein